MTEQNLQLVVIQGCDKLTCEILIGFIGFGWLNYHNYSLYCAVTTQSIFGATPFPIHCLMTNKRYPIAVILSPLIRFKVQFIPPPIRFSPQSCGEGGKCMLCKVLTSSVTKISSEFIHKQHSISKLLYNYILIKTLQVCFFFNSLVYINTFQQNQQLI